MRIQSQILNSKQDEMDAIFEEQYQGGYKRILPFLYSHPNFLFSFSFTGCQIEWFAKQHKEFLLLISEMSSRKQIELLGGAFHNPLLPSLLPIDRVGQIELMTTTIRQHTGKRPRGMLLPNNAWDASLVSSLKTCAMEFVLVDRNIIPKDRTLFLPYIVQEQGKNIYVLVEDDELCPDVSCSPQEYLKELSLRIQNSCPDADNPIVCCRLSPERLCQLVDSGWLEKFGAVVTEEPYKDAFVWDLPSRYIKTAQHYQRAYLPAGIYVPETSTIRNIYEYMLEDSNVYMLYSKMMYVSMVVGQSRGDKSRKKTTQELVWQAQNGAAYMPSLGQTPYGLRQRLCAYRSLIQAERTVRDYTGFFDSVTTFDYDADGIREYICQFEQFNTYIQARGGCVFEFDVLKTAHNYAGCLTGQTGLFLDYFSEPESSVRNDVFSRQIYREVSFDAKRHEIKLLASGNIGELGQPVALRKNYYVNANGIQVQYIIKNESPFPLRQSFSVLSNLLVPVVDGDFRTEIISGELKKLQTLDGCLKDVIKQDASLVRFSDGEVTFVFELNESACVSFSVVDGCLSVGLAWSMEIPPERETEKTISFSVIPKTTTRRRKKN